MADDVVLRASGLRKRFGGLVAVDGMDLDVRRGSMHGLVGPNGAGKTTFFNLLAGALRPDAGRVTFEGEDVTGLPPHRVCRRGLVRTFQITRSLDRLTVLENCMLAAQGQAGERLANVLLRPRRVAREEGEVRERALATLRDLGLDAKADAYAGSLSGGQKKLLEIARAMMAGPRMLLLDEPMAGVNPTLGRRIMDDLERLRRERGLTFLLIEHDMETVMTRCDRVTVMAEGRKLAEGTPDEVRRERAVLDAYLGTPVEDAS